MCLVIVSSPAHNPIIRIRLDAIIAFAFFNAGEVFMLGKQLHDIRRNILRGTCRHIVHDRWTEVHHCLKMLKDSSR